MRSTGKSLQLTVRCCLLVARPTWMQCNFDRYPFNALYWTLLYFQQFWLCYFEKRIATHWAHCHSSKCVKLVKISLRVMLRKMFG